MDYSLYLRAIASLLFVLGLMLSLFWLVRRFNLAPGAVRPAGKQRRLAISDSLMLDARHRLVLVRRDGVEHLVLLGPTGETVVESGIPSPLPEAINP